MALAFKEWAYIVDALGKGKQSIIIRKGGISEEGGDFTLKGKRFLLFPTQFHQAKEMIKEEWLRDLNIVPYFPSQDKVRIEYFAEVAGSSQIKEYEILEKLNSQHAWKPEVIKERFNRWEKSAHLLIVQVFRLTTPYELEVTPEFGGCKSWLELEGAPELSGTLVVNQVLKGRF
jgi:hypothetical protein